MKRPIVLSVAAASLTGVMLLVGCQDRPTAPPLPGGPLPAISDAAHPLLGANPNFYWLPPMVSPPSPTGVFNPRLESMLEVVICEVAGSTCTRTITTLQPLLVEAAERYEVLWHTDESDLVPGQTYRIRALASGLELGFADLAVGNNAGELRNINTDEAIRLVDGRTLPIHMRVEEGAVTFAATGTQCVDCVEFVVDPLTGGTFSHPSLLGATTIDPSDIPEDTPPFVLVIDDQTSLGEPGRTPFDEFPFFFDFSTVPPVEFVPPGVLVGVCQDDTSLPEGLNHSLLRLAHELPTDPTGFEILESVPPPPLSCINGGGGGGSANAGSTGRGGTYLANIPGGRLVQRLLPLVTRIWRPRPLHAAALGHGGLGGLVVSFSDIYAVDPTSAPAPSAVVLYGVNSSDDGLSTIDVTSGNVVFVGDLHPNADEFSTPISMAVRSADNTIFVWNNSGTTTAEVLATVDVCTGLATTLSTTFKGIKRAIAFGSASVLGADSLFGFNGSGPDSLIVIDPVTGAKVGGFPLSSPRNIFGADFDGSGILYGVQSLANTVVPSTTDSLVTIGTTGEVTVVGGLSVDIGVPGSIVFASDGTLIGSGLNGPSGSIIFDIDPLNGNVSNVRPLIGGFAPQGLGFAAACSL